jgi:hypothetical protein
MAGPFSQSEIAGMILLTGLLLSLWAGRKNYREKASLSSPPPPLKKGRYHIWVLALALFMTQARGPWIGSVLALAVASIGNAKRPLRRSIVVFTCIIVIGTPAYIFGKDYLAGPRRNYGSEKETAQYRAELISNYIPVAQRGGLWGWGGQFPRVGGQGSIDNEYLYVWITQGSVGLTALVLMMVETIVALGIKGVRARTVRDRYFIFTFLGIFIGLAFTLSTVYMGDQSYELLFLLIGWAQAIHAPRVKRLEVRNVDVYSMAGEPSTLQVYS